MAKEKFTVLKPVLHGGKIQPKGATLELDFSLPSTKRLVKTEHVEVARREEKKSEREEKKSEQPGGRPQGQ